MEGVINYDTIYDSVDYIDIYGGIHRTCCCSRRCGIYDHIWRRDRMHRICSIADEMAHSKKKKVRGS